MEKVAIKIQSEADYFNTLEVLINNGYSENEDWNEECYSEHWIENEMYIIINEDSVFELHNHDDDLELKYKNINEFLKENGTNKIQI